MKKFLFILMLSLVFVSCETKESLTDDISKLRNEKEVLSKNVDSLNVEIVELNSNIVSLSEKFKELTIYEERTPKYVLKLRLKQSHFSLDIGKHIKDAANAIEFEMPVDRDFYNSVDVGTNIVDEFRAGSFLLSGSFGDWEMTVKGKEIR